MVKVKYIGDISPVMIKVYGSRYLFEREEVKDVDKKYADKLLENRNFSKVEVKKKKKVKKTTKKEEKEDSQEDNNKEE